MMAWAPLKTVANGPSARRTARRNRSVEVIHEGEPALFGLHASRASERPSPGSGRGAPRNAAIEPCSRLLVVHTFPNRKNFVSSALCWQSVTTKN